MSILYDCGTEMKSELKSIQILRGIAALMVVLYHFRPVLNSEGVRLGDYLFGKGFVGVDLFFVISGFIMAYTTSLTNDAVADVKSFAIKRASRIYPVLFTSFIIASLSFMDLERVLSQSFLETLSSIVLIPTTSSFPPFFIDTHSILGVRWTLNYEVYFYSIFAISLFFGKRRHYVLLSWIIVTVFFSQLLINGSFSAKAVSPSFESPWLSMITNSIVLDFAIGVVVAMAIEAGVIINKRLSIACLIFVAYVSMNQVADVKGHGLSEFGIYSAIIVYLCVCLEKNGFSFNSPALEHLGNISYSLYLLHLSVSTFVGIIVTNLGVREYFSNGIYMVTLVAISVMSAHISYKYVELSLSRRVRGWMMIKSGILAKDKI